tara:strand:- start:616 stop:1284 length:669 start_codon:yes stop_codon:yes gene_type:complete
MPYTIIIPVYNEYAYIPKLLSELEYFGQNNELIIIDDGSFDKSGEILKSCSFITLIQFRNNKGKGEAILAGLKKASNNMILLFDGDLELNPKELTNFMILDKSNKIDGVFGSRINYMNPMKSILCFGNFLLNALFNFIHQSDYTDVLCGCKAFHKSDLDIENLQSTGFDIDIEIASKLVTNNCSIREINLTYNRRSYEDGKKIKLTDGLRILIQMFNNIKSK